MTTLTSEPGVVIGGVDTHADVHVAAACDRLGALLGTASFPTTRVGYRALLRFLCSFGQLQAVGVEGTGSYGSGLARYLADRDVVVVEVNRPNDRGGAAGTAHRAPLGPQVPHPGPQPAARVGLDRT
jgi:hypothetical protein